MKKLLSFIVIMCMIIVSVPINASATGICSSYNGDNSEDQNYTYWATPIKSYISKCSNGNLMKVQAGNSISGVLVEYYDTSYNLLSNKLLPQELPIFGAFYESASNYFLLTGQTNKEELSTTEVYRLTKYDKNWNRISSVGVYNANTTVPFDAGSARMVMYGNILIIHTSHEMYTYSDGYNHQANITFSINTSTMKLIKCKSSISNSATGYVSHSFNQFIQLDGKNIVTVDHGDAHPRSIALIKHSSDASTGEFGSGCTVKNILNIPGDNGDNYTGASVGGFEISSSSYLIAGNTVAQDDNYYNNSTRNIFVASLTGSTTKLNQITNYAEGEATASTPHFVKIATDKYMLMWSRSNTVYYTTIDANGNKTSSIYSMNGNLSDCVPVVINNKLVWYVWKNSKNTFYEINLSSLSKNSSTTVDTGHNYEFVSTSDGVSTLKCHKCGAEDTIAVPTSMRVWWKTASNTDGYYYSGISGDLIAGETLKIMIKYTPASYDVNSDFDVIISDDSILSYKLNSAYSGQVLGEFSLLKAGKATVTFKHKYNPSLTATYNITVKSNATAVTLDKSSLEMATGGKYTLKPVFTPVNASAVCSWSSSNTAVATVDSTGTVTANKAGTAVITLTLDNKLIATCTVTVKDTPIALGDVNADRVIDNKDVILTLKHCLNNSTLTEEQITYADVNKSGTVTIIDSILLQHYILGNITSF